ncbi:hypothetical protein [Cohnella cellulosilytica]|uniref:Uncharacterized protein n=1 Tax=Cohnella cellulosilytica TaxID=986710 RepID=A0ABW2F3F0_9BACL
MRHKPGERKSSNGRGWLVCLLFVLVAAALAGCSIEMNTEFEISSDSTHAAAETVETRAADPDAAGAGRSGTKAVCEAYEEEAGNGACSYTIDCDSARSCEEWSARMIGEMESWLGDLTYSEEWDVDEQESEKEADVLAFYEVDGSELDLDPSNEDEAYYAWLWERFAWIIPEEYREMITGFELYDHADLLAYVVQNEDDYEEWTYAANLLQSTYETERVMTDIHEFGHLLSLNADEVDPYEDESDCDTYMLDEGCPYDDSYIYRFYREFWKGGASEDPDDYVTDYAMSNLYEDFAESWSYFVMTVRPEGKTEADRKVRFFYDYDELVMLKASILGRAASWIDRNVEWE